MKNTFAIIGRPNVGKSTLFNRLVGKRHSIIHDEAGVTRDRIYYDTKWTGVPFQLIDTGGIEISNKPFQEQITIQAKIAIEEANVIGIIVDGREGITNDDRIVISLARKSGHKIILIVNKLEGNREPDSSIYTTGIEHVFNISAMHGEGVGDLLEEVIKDFEPEQEESSLPKIAIIGRPNAGKSTLLNSLSNDERAIVSPIAGTTRDSISSDIKINDELEFEVIDTAGINRKSKLEESVEHYALGRAFNSLDSADLSLLIIDSTRDLAHFDARVAGYAMEMNKPLIIVVNKWDLQKKDSNTVNVFEKRIRKEFKFLSWAPIVFISAIESKRLNKLKEAIAMVWANINKRIKTNLLNNMLIDIQMMQPAPAYQGGNLSIAFGKQVEAKIPTFVMSANNIKYLHFTYKRFLENQIREYFGFEGTPIKILIRNKKDRNVY